ncbi:tubby-like F-box protein 2 [Cicer arietinum]|uniref:Tubby-like F-box protein n=1 Tax=Cicer arietinum TaxID=3827 RepID=A0A1S3EHU1_CICAR|nr:tubby-like F-box protein 5 [Cicer arietinum]XP_012574521.1 tubby-like F-box protein 5 [Cicer arietinum]XP_012574522.1 tubby-like F-box protein 5 [Cicer arietinum]
MSLRSIVRELKEMRDGIGNTSRRRVGNRNSQRRTKSHIVPDITLTTLEPVQQGQWANIPPELLLDIIRRVEETETSWPARAAVVSCASVCKSWRAVTKEIVQTPEQCGRLTFPISLKQPGPRDSPIQCFIRRDRETSVYQLYYGLVPSENESDKLLLAAKKIRRATGTDFIISLVADDFSRSSNAYVGKLRSNFLGTKFTIYDSQPPQGTGIQPNRRSSRRFHSKQVSPRVPACNYIISTIAYELNVLRTRGPRRMNCIMNSIPVSAVQEGGTAPTPTSFPQITDEHICPALAPAPKGNVPIGDLSNSSLLEMPAQSQGSVESLVLKNKSPRWHEQLQCWCLNFRGRVTVASVKNFQLVAAVDPSHNVSAAEQEKVILQFGKIGKDIFTMDYRYPISAFQAFAICLSSFDTKPACE